MTRRPQHDPLGELRQLWLDDPGLAPSLDAPVLERAARRLQRRVWIRNLTEWSAAALLLPLCAHLALRTPRLGTRLGLLCMALAGIYVSAELYRRGRQGRLPAAAHTAEFLQAHVSALGRQAQLLESVWRWYLLPFVPGITIVYADAALAAFMSSGGAAPVQVWLTVGGGWLLTCLVFVGVGALNGRAARALRREMAALGES